MTAFDAALEQKSDPVFQVLDALFARIQADQKHVHRQYLTITELRGCARRLISDRVDVALAIDGDALVLRVAVPGLTGLTGARHGGGDLVLGDAGNLPSFVPPARAVIRVAPTDVGAFKGLADDDQPTGDLSEGIDADPAPAPEDTAAPAASTADLVAEIVRQMHTGLRRMEAVAAAAAALGLSERAAHSRLRRGGDVMLHDALSDHPVPVDVIVARLQTDRRRVQVRAGSWSAEEDDKLLAGAVRRMCEGVGKLAAIHAAAADLNRSPRAGEGRLFGALASRFDAELLKAGQPARAPAPVGPAKVWTAAEDKVLIRLVADAICAGREKREGVAAAAHQLNRGFHGVMYRILNKAKDGLECELAARAGLPHSPTVAAVAPAVPAADPVPPRDAADCGGGSPSSPTAPVPVAVAPVVKASLTAAPVPAPAPEPVAPAAPKAPAPAIAATACPPRPAAGERVSQVAPPDDLGPVLDHLRALTKGDASVLKSDFAIMHLACAGWPMDYIATDLGMDSKAVSQRFKALCGYEGGKVRFVRSHVYAGLEALLTPKAVVA